MNEFGFISRRRLLKLGLSGGAVLLSSGAGLLVLRGRAPKVEGLRILNDQEYRTLSHLARTHVPPGGAFPEGADEAGLARAFDGFLADEPLENIRDLKAALTLIELGPVLFEGRLTTFSNLSTKDQLSYWQGWPTSRLLLRRQTAIAFRKFFSIVFYDRRSVWPHIGYPGPAFVTDTP